MGFFRWLRGGSAGTDLLRLQIIIDFSVLVRQGVAAVRWASPSQLPHETETLARITLVTLFYIEILWAHDETRGELFTRIDRASQEILHSNGNSSFKFENWEVHVLGKGYPIWPWRIVTPEILSGALSPHLSKPKNYVVTLKSGKPTNYRPNGIWIFIDMSRGQERILAPASVLIALSTLSEELTHKDERKKLALLLWHVNRYYETPNRVRMWSGPQAVAAAIEVLQKEGYIYVNSITKM